MQVLISYQSIYSNLSHPVNINLQNNQGKFVSTSKKGNTNGNKILKVQIFLLQKS